MDAGLNSRGAYLTHPEIIESDGSDNAFVPADMRARQICRACRSIGEIEPSRSSCMERRGNGATGWLSAGALQGCSHEGLIPAGCRRRKWVGDEKDRMVALMRSAVERLSMRM